MASAKPFVDNKIVSRKVILFTGRYCPESANSKTILDAYEMDCRDYEVVELTSRSDLPQIHNYLWTICLTDQRSLPRLFVNGKFAGDGDWIRRNHDSHKLQKIFRDAGALKLGTDKSKKIDSASVQTKPMATEQ